MRDIGRKVKNLDEVFLNSKMELNIMESGKMIWQMEKELSYIITEIVIKDFLNKIKKMGLELIKGKNMVKNIIMRDIGKMIKNGLKAFTIMKMVTFMRANGKMI